MSDKTIFIEYNSSSEKLYLDILFSKDEISNIFEISFFLSEEIFEIGEVTDISSTELLTSLFKGFGFHSTKLAHKNRDDTDFFIVINKKQKI